MDEKIYNQYKGMNKEEMKKEILWLVQESRIGKKNTAYLYECIKYLRERIKEV